MTWYRYKLQRIRLSGYNIDMVKDYSKKSKYKSYGKQREKLMKFFETILLLCLEVELHSVINRTQQEL